MAMKSVPVYNDHSLCYRSDFFTLIDTVLIWASCVYCWTALNKVSDESFNIYTLLIKDGRTALCLLSS